MKKIIIWIIGLLFFVNVKAQLTFPLTPGDLITTGGFFQYPAGAGTDTVLFMFRAGNTTSVPMNGQVWTNTNPVTNPRPIARKWGYNQLGNIFGITVDDKYRVYVANTSIRYLIHSTLKSNIYMIDGSGTSYTPTIVASPTTSGMANLVGEYGNLKFVRMNGIGYIYVTDFGAKKIHCLEQNASGGLLYKYSFDPNFGTGTQGQIPYGVAVRKLSTGAYKLYYSRMGRGNAWNQGGNTIYGTNNNEIWTVDLDGSTGNFLAATETKQILPVLLEENPIADISFSSDFTKMLFGQQSITNGTTLASAGTPYPAGSLGAHESRVYEMIESSTDNWNFSNGTSTTFGSGNTSMANYAKGKNAVGGVTYSNGILGKNNIFKCDTAVWFTSDIIYSSSSGVPPPAPMSAPDNFVYGFQGMKRTGGNETSAINVDLDNIYTTSSSSPVHTHTMGKGHMGDIEMVNDTLKCPTSYQECQCGEWGSIGYSINGIVNKFLCTPNGVSTILNVNQGDLFTLNPTYNCIGATAAQACNALIKYDIYFPKGSVLLGVNNIKDRRFDSCGDIRVVMRPTCNGVQCPPCEFIVKVKCCNCSQDIKPTIYWQNGTSQDSIKLNCGDTKTNILDCFKEYTIKVKSPCGTECEPDSIETTIKYPDLSTAVSYSLVGTPMSVGTMIGNYEVTIRVKCNGVWCAPCKIIFKQTKSCPPACDNCKDKVQVTFNSGVSTVAVAAHPAASTLNASFFLDGGTDTYTEVRANIVDVQVTSGQYINNVFVSGSKECLQCYNSANNWGSIVGGVLTGFTSAITSYAGVGATNPNNNPREIVFATTTPTAVPFGTPLNLTIKIPGISTISCCCINVKVFVKITYRNNKCEECSKVVLIDLTQCPGGGTTQNGGVGTATFYSGGHPQFRISAPTNGTTAPVNFSSEPINKNNN